LECGCSGYASYELNLGAQCDLTAASAYPRQIHRTLRPDRSTVALPDPEALTAS